MRESTGLTPATASRSASRGITQREWATPAPRAPKRAYPRQPLPAKWQTYLATGRKPAWSKAHSPTTDTSRSTYELMCTAAMLRAGMSHDEAWRAIETAHPDAMTRSRASWPRWVRAVWNVTVTSDDDFAPVPRVDEPILQATQEARDRLRTFAWTLEMRERVSMLTVAAVLLRRIERDGVLRVPCPERDLVLDTGIASRTTIRAALRRLHGVLGTLHTDTLDSAKRASTSFEFEIPAASGVVRDIAPPSLHIPLAPALPGDLPPAAWLLLSCLQVTDGLSAEDVALKAQLCPSPAEVLAWSRRQVLRHLAELQAHGLARVSAEGLWTRPQELPMSQAGMGRHEQLKQRITLERQAFREAPSQWVRDQRAALQVCRQRAGAWWAARSLQEREQRIRRLGAVFSELSVWRQQQRKRGWEDRNLRHGVNLVERHEVWVQAQDVREFERRCEHRRIWFANLPQPMRQAYATAWREHRERYGYPSPASRVDELRRAKNRC